MYDSVFDQDNGVLVFCLQIVMVEAADHHPNSTKLQYRHNILWILCYTGRMKFFIYFDEN